MSSHTPAQQRTRRAPQALRRALPAGAALALSVVIIALPLSGVAQAPEPLLPATPARTVMPISAMPAAAIASAGSIGPVIVVEPLCCAPSDGSVVAQPADAHPDGSVAATAPGALDQPVAVEGPRLSPPAIPHSQVLDPNTVNHELLAPPPLTALQANVAGDALGERQEVPGRGISEAVTPIASGLTLFPATGDLLVVTLLPAGGATGSSLPAGMAYTAGRTLIGSAAHQAALESTAAATPAGAQVGAPAAFLPSPNLPAEVVAHATAVGTDLFAQPAASSDARPAPTVTYADDATAAFPPTAPAPARTSTLVDHVCLDFNAANEWATRAPLPSDIWTDWFAGWGPFAVDDGLYIADNVSFSLERVAGPGANYGPAEFSAKITSNQPYAAGFASPRLHVRPGSTVIVRANYLIYDHDVHGDDLDWAALGIKPDATRPGATYVNGFVRGRWATLTHSVVAGPTGEIMVLLQAHSPASLNSNIYFDNVRIWVDGVAASDCRYEQPLSARSGM